MPSSTSLHSNPMMWGGCSIIMVLLVASEDPPGTLQYSQSFNSLRNIKRDIKLLCLLYFMEFEERSNYIEALYRRLLVCMQSMYMHYNLNHGIPTDKYQGTLPNWFCVIMTLCTLVPPPGALTLQCPGKVAEQIIFSSTNSIKTPASTQTQRWFELKRSLWPHVNSPPPLIIFFGKIKVGSVLFVGWKITTNNIVYSVFFLLYSISLMRFIDLVMIVLTTLLSFALSVTITAGLNTTCKYNSRYDR